MMIQMIDLKVKTKVFNYLYLLSEYTHKNNNKVLLEV